MLESDKKIEERRCWVNSYERDLPKPDDKD